jgi:hypothetical protein
MLRVSQALREMQAFKCSDLKASREAGFLFCPFGIASDRNSHNICAHHASIYADFKINSALLVSIPRYIFIISHQTQHNTLDFDLFCLTHRSLPIFIMVALGFK